MHLNDEILLLLRKNGVLIRDPSYNNKNHFKNKNSQNKKQNIL